MLAWWRHARPRDAVLRAVAVRDGAKLVAVAPFFVRRSRLGLAVYRVLGRPTCYRAEPVAAQGRVPECATLAARTLASVRPAPDLLQFEGISERCEWPEELAHAWPAWSWSGRITVAPVTSLTGSFDSWLASRGR